MRKYKIYNKTITQEEYESNRSFWRNSYNKPEYDYTVVKVASENHCMYLSQGPLNEAFVTIDELVNDLDNVLEFLNHYSVLDVVESSTMKVKFVISEY